MPDSTPHPPRVAVLGATGFIGRVLAETLAADGFEVLGVARRQPAVPARIEFAAFDLSEEGPDALAALLTDRRIDVVVNAAGGMWGLTDEQMVKANVGMVGDLLGALSAMARPARLIHLGTVHEYGQVPVGVSQREDSRPDPTMVYGRLKLRATELIVEAADRGTVQAVVLRLGNVVGAGQPGHSLLGVMAEKLATAAAAGGVAELSLAPLTAQRDFVDLSDTVAAVQAAVSAISGPDAERLPHVINIGTGAATSARTMVELLIAASGVPTAVTEVPAPAGTGPETEWQQLDIALAGTALAWRPKHSHQESLGALWQHHAAEAGVAPATSDNPR